MRRAIIHVGMPRTGSTTFQHVLTRLRADLHHIGVLYPALTPASAAHAPHLNHQHLGETLDGRRPKRERAELLDSLARAMEASRADVVLISYESLIQPTWRARTPARMRDFFARNGCAMEALVVVKPQSEQVNSVYSHRAQFMRERRDLAGFTASYESSPWLKYDALIQPWIAACDGRVGAIALRDRRSAAPLVRRMLAAMGLDARMATLLRPDDLQRMDNRSPGPVAIEVSRRLVAARAHLRLREPPREVMRFVEQAAAERGLDSAGFRGVGPELRARLASRFAPANDRFARAMWGCDWNEVVEQPDARATNEVAGRAADPATERAIADIMARTLDQFGVREVGALAALRAIRPLKWRT